MTQQDDRLRKHIEDQRRADDMTHHFSAGYKHAGMTARRRLQPKVDKFYAEAETDAEKQAIRTVAFMILNELDDIEAGK